MPSSTSASLSERLGRVRLDVGSRWRRPIVATALVGALLLAWQVFGTWHAATHLSPELDALLRERGRADIEVLLPFAPEKFHLLYFQKRGRMLGIEGERVLMADIPEHQIREVAREYWVISVRALEQR